MPHLPHTRKKEEEEARDQEEHLENCLHQKEKRNILTMET